MPQVAEGEEVEIAPAVYVWCGGVLLLALILLGVTLSTDRWRMLNVGEVVGYLLAMVPISVVWLWIAGRIFVDCDTQWPLTALQVAMSEAIVLVLCVFVGSRMGLEFHPLWPWNVVISVVAGFLLYNLVLKLDTTDAALVVLFQRAIGIGVFYGVVRIVS